MELNKGGRTLISSPPLTVATILIAVSCILFFLPSRYLSAQTTEVPLEEPPPANATPTGATMEVAPAAGGEDILNFNDLAPSSPPLPSFPPVESGGEMIGPVSPSSAEGTDQALIDDLDMGFNSPGPISPSAGAGANPSSSESYTMGNDVLDLANVPADAFPKEGKRFPVYLALTLNGMYDDNIYLDSSNPVADFIWRIAPSIAYQTSAPGDNLPQWASIAFTPTFIFYTNNTSSNSIDYNAVASYRLILKKLVINVAQSFERLNDPTVEANGQNVNRNLYTTTAGAQYDYSDKLQFNMNFTQSISDYEDPDFSNANQWVLDTFFLYNILPKVKLGIGPTFGFLTYENEPSQAYQQLLLRLNYEMTGKISLNASGGVEFREFEGNAVPMTVNGVFRIGAEYRPFDSTTASLSAYRQITPSYVQGGQNVTMTGVDLSVRQRFFLRYFVTVSGGIENDHYTDASADADANRDDYYWYSRVALDYAVSTWFSVGATYTHRQNISNSEDHSFLDNQAAIQAQFRY